MLKLSIDMGYVFKWRNQAISPGTCKRYLIVLDKIKRG